MPPLVHIGIFVGHSREELENLVTLIITNEQEKEEIMRSIAQKYQEEGIEIGSYEEKTRSMKSSGMKMYANELLSCLYLSYL